ncbi:uncharacterized protein MONOS_13521 [Monocercomonoides exilis]|uniref:uncharacterized protein n=1 Tax=Monocercomonoides exilis TaxID=2049356 RepID=UPI00355AB609|nr:hypothetical protein MONOS_13521 [Monocercomonoides exilis]|eukprot:MONOS_13521.1-p1 / transcript=MONOS_13521.1 / gene=MONOS_13521 / organism=Monocercomonoides_exilis_PA203 / gene_product=unspecified product / transcript_product=unspecified product / location=Mono_scaffold00839:17612-18127(-) / protein_length=172 / sequence_SO=supercontig / SO=protein_coding / is_pseudo=false
MPVEKHKQSTFQSPNASVLSFPTTELSFGEMLVMKVTKGSFTEATRDSHTKYISLPTLALLSENTALVMEKEDSDTCEPWLNSIIRAPPFPPEFVSSLTEQVEKVESLAENELAGADEANEMHPPLVGICWRRGAESMLEMVQLVRERERERAGELAINEEMKEERRRNEG